MENLTLIKEAFEGIVGLKGTTKYPVDAPWNAPESGLFVDSVDSLLKASNVDSFKDEATLTEYFAEVVGGCVAEMVGQFRVARNLTKKAPPAFERPIWDLAGYRTTEATGKRVTGFEFNLSGDMLQVGRVLKVSYIGTEAETIPLLLVNASTGEQQTVNLNYTTPNKHQWFDVNFDMPNFSKTVGHSSKWFVGYDQAALSGKPIVNTERTECTSCAHAQTRIFLSGIRINCRLAIRPAVLPQDLNYSGVSYPDGSNFGLNMVVTSDCDYTNFYIDNKMVFAPYLQKAVAIKLLQTFADAPDQVVNRNQTRLSFNRNQILFTLEGSQETNNQGLKYHAQKEFDAINLQTKNLGTFCFPDDANPFTRVM